MRKGGRVGDKGLVTLRRMVSFEGSTIRQCFFAMVFFFFLIYSVFNLALYLFLFLKIADGCSSSNISAILFLQTMLRAIE